MLRILRNSGPKKFIHTGGWFSFDKFDKHTCGLKGKTCISHMPYCVVGERDNEINAKNPEIPSMTKFDLAKMTSELETLNEIVDNYQKSVADKTNKDLAKNLPKEIHKFFNVYSQEILEGMTRNIPKDAKWPLLLKRQISEKIPAFVSASLNEMLFDVKKYSNKDFTKIQY